MTLDPGRSPRSPRPWTLARQYSLASLLVLLASLLVLGWWVGRQIEVGVTHRAAAAAALFVENYIVTPLQGLPARPWLTGAEKAELGWLLSNTPLGQDVVNIKVWAPGGRIVYGDQAGTTFEVDDEQARAWKGEVASGISNLTEDENRHLKRQHGRLLEIYAPIRQEGTDHVIAVAEFYHTVAALERDVRQAQLRSWAVVGSVMLLAYLLLAGLVRRGSDTIARQQSVLNAQVAAQQALLAQNAELHERVQRAATRIAEVHERVMERVSSDLHDGPAQDVSYALLRLDSLALHAGQEGAPTRAQTQRDLDALERSLTRAMQAMRDLAASVRLPDLQGLTLEDTLDRAVRDHRARTGSEVRTDWPALPADAPLPVKITAFRIVREALSNAFKHAGGQGQAVCAQVQGGLLTVQVTDTGPGFDATRPAAGDRHLGLVSMRERAESLGGHFTVRSGPAGTTVRAELPLTEFTGAPA